jgi:hypothetical protein
MTDFTESLLEPNQTFLDDADSVVRRKTFQQEESDRSAEVQFVRRLVGPTLLKEEKTNVK